jgi:hypothetical protein
MDGHLISFYGFSVADLSATTIKEFFNCNARIFFSSILGLDPHSVETGHFTTRVPLLSG